MVENRIRDAQYPKIVSFAFFIVIKHLLYHCYYKAPLIKNTGRHLLPKVYINPNDFLSESSYSGKTKVSVQKITLTFGLSRGVVSQISEHDGKKWKSVSLLLSSEKYSWFTIDRTYWKRNQIAIEVLDDPNVWLETDNYILIVEEKKNLLSDTK